jgi:all-trans-8'-apo-beta-carotenal 15,15'-oxygenase
VRSRRTIYGFGDRLGKDAAIDLYAMPEDGRARRIGGFPLPHAAMVHDFAVTDRHLVFLISPVRMSLWRVLTGGRDFSKYFQWRPEDGSEVVVVPIDAPDQITRFPVDPFFVWHFAGAFERGSEIVVDLIRYDDFSSFDALRDDTDRIAGTYHRARIDPAQRTFAAERIWDGSCEFPSTDPRLAGGAWRWSWAVTERGPIRRIVRIDAERSEVRTFVLPATHRPSEALFVPRADAGAEDDGWLLSLVYDEATDQSHVAVFDAATFTDGPIGRAHLGHRVPMTYHGTWLAG